MDSAFLHEEALSNIQANKAQIWTLVNLDTAAEVRSQDLMETMVSLERAVDALEREVNFKVESFELWVSPLSAGKVATKCDFEEEADADGCLLSAGSPLFGCPKDGGGLTAFIQSGGGDEVDELQPAYESKSGSIVEMLEDMQDKAKSELNGLRQREESAKHSFAMMRQSLEDQVSFAQEEVGKLKASQAQLRTSKTTAQKDLEEAESDLQADKKELDDVKMECRRKAEDYKLAPQRLQAFGSPGVGPPSRRQMEKKGLAEELEALGKAKEALAEKTGLEATSFFQAIIETVGSLRSMIPSRCDYFVEVEMVSWQFSAKLHAGSDLTSSADAFGKIKTMIADSAVCTEMALKMWDMIDSMEKKLREEAGKKAYCDAEMKKAASKQEGKQSELEDLQTKIDAATSKSAALKEEVADLQKALVTIGEFQVNTTAMRQKEKAQFKKAFPEVQEGLDGVKTALKVLREYYKGTQAATERGGAATGVMGMLEVVESDFAKNLAEMRVAEATAQEDFKKDMQDLELEKARKEQDVKYKAQEAKRLDVELQEFRSDSDNVQTELSAIEEFNSGLQVQEVATSFSSVYSSIQERRAKRQAEIEGLKTALEALDAESATGLMPGSQFRLAAEDREEGRPLVFVLNPTLKLKQEKQCPPDLGKTPPPPEAMQKSSRYRAGGCDYSVDPQAGSRHPTVDLVELPRLAVNFKSVQKGPNVKVFRPVIDSDPFSTELVFARLDAGECQIFNQLSIIAPLQITLAMCNAPGLEWPWENCKEVEGYLSYARLSECTAAAKALARFSTLPALPGRGGTAGGELIGLEAHDMLRICSDERKRRELVRAEVKAMKRQFWGRQAASRMGTYGKVKLMWGPWTQ
ncbi:unnamed protein product [Symbiodinium microadriaticum]|nr:unnamed protein product [Symbiodinium microadriaticum]